MFTKLLIVGKLPAPIGGVTQHTKRLVDNLKNENIRFHFISITNKVSFIVTLVREITNARVIHLHSSNPVLRFVIGVICKIKKKRFINTIHGNLGRFNFLYNFLDIKSIQLSTYPIVLNESSFKIAQIYNNNTLKLSAFIPPVINNSLNVEEIGQDILHKIQKFRTIFCTNAFNVSFDNKGQEIYGISMLVEIFNNYNKRCLIISDPSGKYKKYLMKHIRFSKNIFLISYEHDFLNVLSISDCFIRATTTDGDSLSIWEAIYLGKNVIASNCVSRPDNVILYETNNKKDLENKIQNYTKEKFENIEMPKTIEKLLKLYSE